MSGEQHVRHAVYTQRTSPNFAEFCITHVTDPTHQFLFSASNTPERRLYLRLLDEARLSNKHRSHGKPEDDSECARTGTSHCPFFAASGTTQDLYAPPCFSLYDVDLLWDNLGSLFARNPWRTAGGSSSSARRRGIDGWKRAREPVRMMQDVNTPREDSDADDEDVVCGPHAPHLFPTKAALQRFLVALLHVAKNPERDVCQDLVARMMGALPQTEALLYVCLYVFTELLAFAERRHAQHVAHNGCVEEGARDVGSYFHESQPALREDIDTEEDNKEGEVSFLRYVEGATAVLFVANQLLLAHRSREAALVVAAGADASPSSPAPHARVYYQAVFDKYLPRMIDAYVRFVSRLVAIPGVGEGVGKGSEKRSTDMGSLEETTGYMVETVQQWRAECALHSPAAHHLLEACATRLEALLSTGEGL